MPKYRHGNKTLAHIVKAKAIRLDLKTSNFYNSFASIRKEKPPVYPDEIH